jgi:hypothetical protein
VSHRLVATRCVGGRDQITGRRAFASHFFILV